MALYVVGDDDGSDDNLFNESTSNLEDVIFSRLTGSGSCIFSVFQNKTEAKKAQIQFNKDFPKLWSHLAENNKLNLF